jgi:glutaredoxin
MPTSKPLPVWLALLLCSLALPAWAAYKIVGPDGRITYTDRPPSDQATQPVGKSKASTAAAVGLPYELQQATSRHPVTLYTSRECAFCDTARQLLRSRGVPYTEKTVNTPEDIRALSTLEGSNQLPTLRIGGKRIIGLQQSEWKAYLDAAGYPDQSKLPVGYVQPEASPLAPPKSEPNTQFDNKREGGDRPPAPTIGAPPSGIRF